ncbi:UNVERIFIED_CONTAM: hypothetical protein RMT77_002544 [Armadillidium vulgare]
MKIALLLPCLFEFSFHSTRSFAPKLNCKFPLETNCLHLRKIAPPLRGETLRIDSLMHKNRGKMHLRRNLKAERYKERAFNDSNNMLAPKVRNLITAENLRGGKRSIQEKRDQNNDERSLFNRQNNPSNNYSNAKRNVKRFIPLEQFPFLPGKNLALPPHQGKNFKLPSLQGNLTPLPALPGMIPGFPGIPLLGQPVPRQLLPQLPLLGQPLPGQSFPGLPLPGQPFPGLPLPRQTIPGLPLPGQTIPGLPLPGQTIPGLPLPGQTIPGLPLPGQTIPGLPLPGQTIPGLPLPGQTIPGLPLPGQTIPGLPLPGQTIPGLPLPGQTIPGLPLPGQTIPGLPLPGQTIPGLPFPGQTIPGLSLPGQTIPGLPFPGQTIPGLPFPGLPLPGQTFPWPPFPGLPFSKTIKTWSSEISYYLGGETFPQEGRFFPFLESCNETFQYHILPSNFFVPPVVVVLALEVSAFKVAIYWREMRLFECAKIADTVCDFVSSERTEDKKDPFILKTTHLLDYSYISIINENGQILVGIGHATISPSLIIATGAEASEVKMAKLSLIKIKAKNDEVPDYYATFPLRALDFDDMDNNSTEDKSSKFKPSESFFDLTFVKNPPYRHRLVEDLMVVERCQREYERDLSKFNISLPFT